MDLVGAQSEAGARIKTKMVELVNLVQQTAKEQPEMQEWLKKTGLLSAQPAQWDAFAG